MRRCRPRQPALASSISVVPVYSFDPLKDPRWDGFIARHPDASIFHTSAWLRALYRTYGYEPIAVHDLATGSRAAERGGVLPVTSWLTGKRLVSLPFSDHCDPLVEDGRQLEELGRHLEGAATREGLELRRDSVAEDRAGGTSSRNHRVSVCTP